MFKKCPSCKEKLPITSLIKDELQCCACKCSLAPRKSSVVVGTLALSFATIVGLNFSVLHMLFADIVIVGFMMFDIQKT